MGYSNPSESKGPLNSMVEWRKLEVYEVRDPDDGETWELSLWEWKHPRARKAASFEIRQSLEGTVHNMCEATSKKGAMVQLDRMLACLGGRRLQGRWVLTATRTPPGYENIPWPGKCHRGPLPPGPGYKNAYAEYQDSLLKDRCSATAISLTRKLKL